MTCPHMHKDAPENAVCEDCKGKKTKLKRDKDGNLRNDKGELMFQGSPVKTELKTLKDLDRCPDCIYKNDGTACVDYLQLRQEAITWIKELEIHKETDYGLPYEIKIKRLYGGFDDCEVQGFDAQDFIKHFFNIEDEELK